MDTKPTNQPVTDASSLEGGGSSTSVSQARCNDNLGSGEAPRVTAAEPSKGRKVSDPHKAKQLEKEVLQMLQQVSLLEAENREMRSRERVLSMLVDICAEVSEHVRKHTNMLSLSQQQRVLQLEQELAHMQQYLRGGTSTIQPQRHRNYLQLDRYCQH